MSDTLDPPHAAEITPQWRPAVVVAGLVTAVYALFSLVQYAHFVSYSYDLGIFTQAVQGYAQGRGPIVDIKGAGFNLLGDHFSPVLALLAPFYWLWPDPRTLLLAQALAFGVSCLPLTMLAIDRLGRWWGVVFGLAYGFSWGLQSAAEVEFHAISLGVPLLSWALYFFCRERWRAAAAVALPLLLVKEDMGLAVAGLGLAMVLRGEKRLGWALAFTGTLGAAITIKVIIPAFSQEGYAYQSNIVIGSLLEGLGTKAWTTALLLAVSGFVAWASPLALVALPTLAWRFAGDEPGYWGVDWHYSVILMPVMAYACLDVAGRASQFGSPAMRRLAGFAPDLSVVAGVALLPLFPLISMLGSAFYQEGPRNAAAREAVSMVKPGSRVDSDVALMSHLVGRAQVYFLGNVNPPVDYVVADLGWSSASVKDPLKMAHAHHPNQKFTIIYRGDDYVVMHDPSAPRTTSVSPEQSP